MTSIRWADLEMGDVVEATVRLRRSAAWRVNPSAEPLDGVRMRFRYGWTMGPAEGQYPGEVAMSPPRACSESTGIWYVASGDLVDAVIVDSATLLHFDGGDQVGPVPVDPQPYALVVVPGDLTA